MEMNEGEHGGVGSGGTPAVEHARDGEAGKESDERDAEGGGGMLAGGIVADIELTAGDDPGEVGKGALEEGRRGAASGLLDSMFSDLRIGVNSASSSALQTEL